MTNLSSFQERVAVAMLKTIAAKKYRITYDDLGAQVETKMLPSNFGQHLGKVTELCNDLGLPFISGLVVGKYSDRPSKGYYPLCRALRSDYKSKSDEEIYQSEISRIKACTQWYELAEYLKQHIDGLNRSIPEIRILPMSKSLEFDNRSIEQVQMEYFQYTLPNRANCKYYCREVSIKSISGSLILFQYDGAIIASAVFDHIEEYQQPIEGVYHGAICFKRDSIRIFQPIFYEELHRIDSTVIRFSQTKQRLNPESMPQILDLIAQKSVPLIPDEVPLDDQHGLKEGAARQILVNAYERNPIARRQCIEHYGSSCIVCGFNFGKVYGPEYEGKIHVHHLKQLSEIKEEYEVDPIEDLRPVCPNCHMVIHQKYPPATITSIKCTLRPESVC